MLLTLANATIQDFTYSWTVSLPHYKIQSITVLSPTPTLFFAKYNQDAIQFILSGRTNSCPSIFSGDFNVYFYTNPPFVLLTDIQDIQIELIECEPPPPPPEPEPPNPISPVLPN